ncbi:MAG: histidine kinase dimerization/phospho-acceptor domain-containing protein, partial [Sulfurimonas sp.]
MFSYILYYYIQSSILEEKHKDLLVYAKNIASNQSIYGQEVPTPEIYLGISIEVIYLKQPLLDIDFFEITKEKKSYVVLMHPLNIDELSYIKITKDITPTRELLNKILNSLFIINIAGFLLVVIYAIALSKMLVLPVRTLSNKLSNMNEHLMRPIIVEELPEEFEPLGATINHLIARIQNFVKYQKELFIGTAHELKTPLAVIKLKNQVTLIKKRSAEEYIDAIKVTNKTIDEMNIIVSNILNIGRQEGMQLE